MKRSFGILALLFGSVYMNAQSNNKMISDKQDSVYCLVMKDGIAVLTNNSGTVITTEINFASGTRITPKGLITKKDGTQIMMKTGECTNTVIDPMKKN